MDHMTGGDDDYSISPVEFTTGGETLYGVFVGYFDSDSGEISVIDRRTPAKEVPKDHKLFRNLIHFEVLTDDGPIPEGLTLEQIYEETMTGGWSGLWWIEEVEALNEEEMATALTAQGSDPGFFQLDDKEAPEEISADLRRFFEWEIANEAQGGVSPATLDSANETLAQVPEDVLLEVGITDPDALEDEFSRLCKHYTGDTALSALIEG